MSVPWHSRAMAETGQPWRRHIDARLSGGGRGRSLKLLSSELVYGSLKVLEVSQKRRE